MLRSLHFGDDDYNQCVHDVVPAVLGDVASDPGNDGPPNLTIVADFLDLPAWLAGHDQNMFDRLFVASDDATLPDGTMLSAAEAAAQRLKVDEMRRQIERIRKYHADDPEALVGQAKELVESTCKTILGLTGTRSETKDDVPKLVKRTLIHLGLDAATVAEKGDDTTEAHALKRILGGVSSVLNGADELRNARGTGHGRSGVPLVDDALARLTVGLVLSAVVYLCEMWEKRAANDAVQPPLLHSTPLHHGFKEGDIIRDDTFGEGQVISVYSEPGRISGDIISVEFGGGVGRKQLLVKYAPLRMVQPSGARPENQL